MNERTGRKRGEGTGKEDCRRTVPAVDKPSKPVRSHLIAASLCGRRQQRQRIESRGLEALIAECPQQDLFKVHLTLKIIGRQLLGSAVKAKGTLQRKRVRELRFNDRTERI